MKLVIQPFGCAPIERNIRVGTSWQRYELSAPSPAEWCFVLLGPDLAADDSESCTVWLDRIQFEQGQTASEYEPRSPVEAGITTRRAGNVFFDGEDAVVDVTVMNAGDETASITLTTTDFDDRVVETAQLIVEPTQTPCTRTVGLGLTERGFYRVRLAVNGERRPRGMRLAVIPRYARKDSVFGMNHAYPWDYLEEECVAAGLLQIRDWSLKWEDVQPKEGGASTSSRGDAQIDRPLSLASRCWVCYRSPRATGPPAPLPSVAAGPVPDIGGRTAYAPAATEFSRYVSETVAHYKGASAGGRCSTSRSTPTTPCLSTTATRARLRALCEALLAGAKAADPDCKVLANVAARRTARRHIEDMLGTGALDYIDAIDIHAYPGLMRPEKLEEGLRLLQDLMKRYGGPKPVWLTEHGYYADDDVEVTPARHGGFDIPLADERLQAAFSMRYNVMLLYHGVERILYHAGTCPGLNGDNREGTFFEYDGAPRKIYAALAAFAELFPPGCRALSELQWGEGVKAYLFDNGEKLVLASWALTEAAQTQVQWTDPRISGRDIMGNALDARSVELGEAPVFILCPRGMTAREVKGALEISRG